MKASEIVKIIYKHFPKSNAAKWDFNGYAFGKGYRKINNILTCLDVTEDVVLFAIANRCEMIISHHPLIFGEKEEELSEPHMAKLAELITKNKLVVFSAHTALDGSKNGMNSWFLDIYKVDKKKYLKGHFAQIGTFNKPTTLNKIVTISKKVFNVDSPQINDFTSKVKKIMIAGGSHDWETIALAKKHKVDLMITGEIKHYDWLYADKINQPLMCIGHYMEIIFNKKMASFLKEKTNLTVIAMKENNLVYNI